MSTKSDLIDVNDGRIYDECSEPQFIFGNFIGNNIYFYVDTKTILSFSFIECYFFLSLKNTSETGKVIGHNIKMFAGDIITVEYDIDDLLLIIRGGSNLSKIIQSKDYKKISI